MPALKSSLLSVVCSPSRPPPPPPPPPPPHVIHVHVHTDVLGERLEAEDDPGYHDNAALCYICSGNVDKFVECW